MHEETAARRLAVQALIHAEAGADLLIPWLDCTASPMHRPRCHTVELDPGRSGAVHAISGAAEEALPGVEAFLVRTGAPAAALHRLRAAVEDLSPTRLGCWLRLRADEDAAGWWMDGPHAWDALPRGAPSDLVPGTVRSWAAGGGRALQAVGAAFGDDDAPWTCTVALAAPTRREMLEVTGGLCQALGVDAIPAAISDVFDTDDVTESGSVTVWGHRGEARQVSVALPAPDVPARLTLMDLLQVADPLGLARAEGALGEPPCDAAVLTLDPDGLSVSFRYVLQ